MVWIFFYGSKNIENIKSLLDENHISNLFLFKKAKLIGYRRIFIGIVAAESKSLAAGGSPASLIKDDTPGIYTTGHIVNLTRLQLSVIDKAEGVFGKDMHKNSYHKVSLPNENFEIDDIKIPKKIKAYIKLIGINKNSLGYVTPNIKYLDAISKTIDKKLSPKIDIFTMENPIKKGTYLYKFNKIS